MNNLNNKDISIQEEIRNVKKKTLKVLTFSELYPVKVDRGNNTNALKTLDL